MATKNRRIVFSFDKDGVLADVIKPAKYSWVNVTKAFSKYLAEDLERLNDERFKYIMKKALDYSINKINGDGIYKLGLAYTLCYIINENDISQTMIEWMLNRINSAGIDDRIIREEYASLALQEDMFAFAVDAINTVPDDKIYIVSSAYGVRDWLKIQLNKFNINKSIVVFEKAADKSIHFIDLSNYGDIIFFTDSIFDVKDGLEAIKKGARLNIYGVTTGLYDRDDFLRYNIEVYDNVLSAVMSLVENKGKG